MPKRKFHPPLPYQPRCFVTMHPKTKQLQIELPANNGRRPPIQFDDIETLRTILQEQLSCSEKGYLTQIGLNSDPTNQQVQHWEQHSKRSNDQKLGSTCPFCRSEASAPIDRYDMNGQPVLDDPTLVGL